MSPLALLSLIASVVCSRDCGRSAASEDNALKQQGYLATLATGPRQLRIGYGKNGALVIARQQAERELAPLRIEVTWVEFASGPPMLEAMNAGRIDLGQVGDTPPIFAQAAGARIVYVAGEVSTNGQGILGMPGSGLQTIADLRGKRVGFTKGSSAHNVVQLALEAAGLAYGDITPVYLSSPDAGPRPRVGPSTPGRSGIRTTRSGNDKAVHTGFQK